LGNAEFPIGIDLALFVEDGGRKKSSYLIDEHFILVAYLASQKLKE
jgi:hypothetical protein